MRARGEVMMRAVWTALAVVGLTLSTWPSLAATGGPDGYGYTWADSDEAGVSYAYEAIYANFQSLTDEDFVEIPLGFDFPFYGGTFNSITVTSNGVAHFDGAQLVGYNNVPLYFGTFRMMAVFWDDLNPGASGDVWWETTGSSPNRVFKVEWWSVPHFYSSGTGTFEIKLFEVDGAVEFHYEDTNFGDGAYNQGASATCGIQDGAQGYSLQRSHEQSVLPNDYAVRFEPGSCSDTDGDGYDANTCGGNDCDDSDSHVYPGATEDCNGIDDDCDGTVDEGCGDDDDTTGTPGDDDDTTGTPGDDDDTGGGPWDDDDADDDTGVGSDDDDSTPGGQHPGNQETPKNSNPTFGIVCACRTASDGAPLGAALLWLSALAGVHLVSRRRR